jgi:chlorite dismutase
MNSSADAHAPSTSPAADTAATEPEAEILGYTLWAVLRRDPSRSSRATVEAGPQTNEGDVAELDAVVAELATTGVVVRGFYDVSALKADSDIMIWLHGAVPEAVQSGYRSLLRTRLLRSLLPTWNVMGMHREAEFSKDHSPAFMRGKEPEAWLTVYPFVRSYEWYLLPDDERRAMLRDHGMKGAAHRQVLTNTVASFSLGDYEWILALEAPELVQLVDLMRDLRYTEARRHVREEVPFYTGRRIATTEIGEVLS